MKMKISLQETKVLIFSVTTNEYLKNNVQFVIAIKIKKEIKKEPLDDVY